MRAATEMDFEIHPSDATDFVIDSVRDALNKIRTLGEDKTLRVKVYVDVEIG